MKKVGKGRGGDDNNKEKMEERGKWEEKNIEIERRGKEGQEKSRKRRRRWIHRRKGKERGGRRDGENLGEEKRRRGIDGSERKGGEGDKTNKEIGDR